VLTSLHSFGEYDGAFPIAGVVQGTDGNFYGATSEEGPGSDGTIFRISVGPGSPTVSIITDDAAFGIKNGHFGFDLTGPTGSNVVIQASADLQYWFTLQTNSFSTGPLYFSDPQPSTNRQRFYRAFLP
jgi:uncharacterized repeat protein (TIGR03803 family)